MCILPPNSFSFYICLSTAIAPSVKMFIVPLGIFHSRPKVVYTFSSDHVREFSSRSTGFKGFSGLHYYQFYESEREKVSTDE